MESVIAEKIRKLHALAARASTEAEAANAAARVAELCRKHNLELGSVLIESQEKKASQGRPKGHAGFWEAHRNDLVVAVGMLFEVGSFRESVPRVDPRFKNGWRAVFYGLKANVEAATLTYSYLDESVEAMLSSAVKTRQVIGGRAQTRSFRMGCARRILDEARKCQQGQRAQLQGSSEEQAIVLVGNQLKRDFESTLRLGKGSFGKGAADGGAYWAGYAAGGRVDLHGARSNRMLKG